jgi:hypothetical protein
MSKSDPIDLSEQIWERINLEGSRIALAAREGGIPEYAEQLARFLEDSHHSYHGRRLYEEVRSLRETYQHMFAPDPEKGFDWSWEELFPPQPGQPPHEALLELYWDLRLFWEELPTKSVVSKRARGRWAPVFRKDWIDMKSSKTKYSDEMEFREAMIPKNGPAKLFLAVAQLFDYSYTASNCRSVVDRVKNLRRSPDGKAKLRERRRRAAARFRAKNRQSSGPQTDSVGSP